MIQCAKRFFVLRTVYSIQISPNLFMHIDFYFSYAFTFTYLAPKHDKLLLFYIIMGY